jgi:hypothetical protein
MRHEAHRKQRIRLDAGIEAMISRAWNEHKT